MWLLVITYPYTNLSYVEYHGNFRSQIDTTHDGRPLNNIPSTRFQLNAQRRLIKWNQDSMEFDEYFMRLWNTQKQRA